MRGNSFTMSICPRLSAQHCTLASPLPRLLGWARRSRPSLPRLSTAHVTRSQVLFVSSVNARQRSASGLAVAGDVDGLDTKELFAEAQIARLSGFCYRPWDEIKSLAAQEKFTVLAGGDTFFTRWYLAQGRLTGGPTASVQDEEAPVTLCLFIRGVMWRASELNTVRVWQQLAKSWPTPYLPGQLQPVTESGAVVQAHNGMAEMAEQLYSQITNHVRSFEGPLLVAGHSMGGSLATLLAVKMAVQGDRAGRDIECRTFGSPPILTSSCGGHGSKVLQAGNISFGIRNWVLDYDPVPRAMLSADPYFQFAVQSEGAKRALSLGRWAFGNSSWLSGTRFLFRSVGDVFLLSRMQRPDKYVPLKEETLEQELRLPVNDMVSKPILLLQTLLDHNHTSYSHDLLSAAKSQYLRDCKVQQN